MKKIILLLTCLAGLMPHGVHASDKVDLLSRSRLRENRLNLKRHAGSDGVALMKAPSSEQAAVCALVELADGQDASSLESEGVEVTAVMGGVALCVMGMDEVDRIASLGCVRTLTVDTPRQPMTRQAREAVNIDAVHAGINLPQAYTGRNVLCAIYDQGLDPNHVNFRDAEGRTRILSLTHQYLNGAGQPVTSEYNSGNVHMFTTDEPRTYHGTHTLGIMAGSYRGALTAAYPDDLDKDRLNPYYGMAPDADLMVTCGPVSDYFIANGVYDIVKYAISNNRPTVINLSLGGNIGTHDGNSAMSKFLEAAGEECIIVMAAGNDGNIPLYATKDFSQDDTEFKTLIRAHYQPESNDNLRYGQVAIYSEDESMFDVQAVVYNRNTGRIAYRIPLIQPGTGVSTYHVTGVDYSVSEEDVYSQPLSKYFNGYLGLGSAMDADTGKFYCVVDYYLTNTRDRNADDMYVPGFIVTGAPGQTVRMWCDGTYTCLDSYGIEGWSDGSTDFTLSDLATARNVVVVGSYNTEGNLRYIDGSMEAFSPDLGEFVSGEITCFSAYGTLADGRKLPHVCAPGVSLVSSTSRYYVEAEGNEIDASKMSALLEADGVNHWWSQTGGTSMATPVVSGAIALWLEANPYLTVDEVIDIIRTTATVDEHVREGGTPVQWGAGKFDAYAGLLEAVRRSGIVAAGRDDSRLLITSDGSRRFNVALPGTKALNVEVYSMTGARMRSVTSNADTAVLDLSGLKPGVYVVRANGSSTQKLILK